MLRNIGPVDILKRTFKEVGKDHVGSFAGALTYSGFLSIFPFSIFLLSLLGLFGAPDLLINGLDRASAALPATESAFLRDQLLSIAQSRAQGAFTIGAIIAILLALWGVSGAFRTVMDAMNVMYEVEEGRPFWKLYPISVFISVGVAILLIIALGLVTFGRQVARTIAAYSGSLGTVFVWVWYVLQWPVLTSRTCKGRLRESMLVARVHELGGSFLSVAGVPCAALIDPYLLRGYMGLYALSALQLALALFAVYVTTKTGSQLRPAAVLMNGFLILYAVVFAAGLFTLAWNQ